MPADVGFAKTDLVLGKHSGRAALADRAKAMGYTLTPEQLRAVFDAFKVLADKKKEVYDEDIAAMIDQQIRDDDDRIVDDRCRTRWRPPAARRPR